MNKTQNKRYEIEVRKQEKIDNKIAIQIQDLNEVIKFYNVTKDCTASIRDLKTIIANVEYLSNSR
jgi:bacterioferritin-associated ferredoxin